MKFRYGTDFLLKVTIQNTELLNTLWKYVTGFRQVQHNFHIITYWLIFETSIGKNKLTITAKNIEKLNDDTNKFSILLNFQKYRYAA